MPGLVQEVKKICKTLGMEDVSHTEITKDEINDALEIHHMKNLREEMGDKIKYSEMNNIDTRKPQTFMKEMNLEECCVAMRIKCLMIDCAGNMRARYRGRETCLKCRLRPGVEGPNMRETQQHLEVCEGYVNLRQGRDMLNFTEKVKYFQELIVEREKMLKRFRKTKTQCMKDK